MTYQLNYMEDSKLMKRFKSLAWRMVMMGLVMVLNFMAANIGLFNLPVEFQVVAGLIAGEISKAVMNYLKAKYPEEY